MSRSEDEEHLKLLSIFHYVMGGFVGLSALFPAIYLVMGLFMVFAPDKFMGKHPGEPPPEFLGWFVLGIGCATMLFSLAMAVCIVFAGRSLARRSRYTYCMVMAGIECLFMPFGTVLGVFTLIVLMRESVKELFQANRELDVSHD